MSYVVVYPTDEEMPGFVADMCKPLFEIIRGLHMDQRIEVLGQYWRVALDYKDDEPEEYAHITTTELALDAFIWNINVNQPSEGAGQDNALGLFMEVAHRAWEVKA